MFVLGTAGHVDHGKSTLVRALTGIDPDRLREEKERGMTIDLGFAWLKLPSGREVSIVDVPGHERFIKNMLAGVGGIDLALLIIAADEGVMPQTREHLAILDLLRVTRGLVVITKSDLVEEDWLELVTADAGELIDGTSLEGAPILAVSATSGAGLDALRAAIDGMLSSLAARLDRKRPRLPIDRVFTIAGFGTVVTGTLIDGVLGVGTEVEILPSGQRTRIRGLQTHRNKVDEAQPGSRVAVNLTGLATTDVSRGEILTVPGWLKPTVAVDVRLRALAGLGRPIRHNAQVTFHSFSSEVNARVRLLDRDELAPGESTWAQIRTETPVAVAKGDLFVIRSANETLGGGEIIETRAKRHRRNDTATLGRLEALEHGSPVEILLQTLQAKEPLEIAALLKAVPVPANDVKPTLVEALDSGAAMVLAGKPPESSAFVVTGAGWEAITKTVAAMLAEFHRQNPLRGGMPKEEIRSRLGHSARLFGDVLAQLKAQGLVEEAGTAVRLTGFVPALSAAQQASVTKYLAELVAEPYSPAPVTALPPDVLGYLIDTGQVVRVNDQVVFAAAAYRDMVSRVSEVMRANGKISIGEVRDLFGNSRKYALGLMEHLDEQKITRRVGDDRVLR